MDAQSIYARYHRLIVTMAETASPHPSSLLQGLLARLDREAETLPAKSGLWLRNELTEQLELRLARTTNARAREIFSLALKHFE